MPRQYWFPKHYADAVQRWRVRVGFALIVVFALAAYPGRWSLTVGLPVAAIGLLLRAWAAGHLDKNGSLATSGPFAFVRNPLYLGTLLTATGFAIACVKRTGLCDFQPNPDFFHELLEGG